MMHRYANRSGRGGVRYFEIGPGFIHLWFKGDDEGYVYDYKRPGRVYVAAMRELALQGQGLTTFVNKHVRGNFSGRTGRLPKPRRQGLASRRQSPARHS